MLSLFRVEPVDLVNVCLERCQGNPHVLVQLLVCEGGVSLQRSNEVFPIRNCRDGNLGRKKRSELTLKKKTISRKKANFEASPNDPAVIPLQGLLIRQIGTCR